jgi:FkbM family methyltransferase
MAGRASSRVQSRLRRLVWRAGYDITPFNAKWSPVARRGKLLGFLKVDLVLDVGANEGQYGVQLREDLGFHGRMCSFEPASEPYRTLAARAARDPGWTTYNLGLGDVQGRAIINVAANSESSSLLAMLPAHLDAAPEARFVGNEEVEMQTLDAIFDDLRRPGERVYLKVDTQGFEGRVLRGAERSLAEIDTVQLEMPLAPLYEGEQGFAELFGHMLDRGFELVGLEPGFSDPNTGRLLQVDGVFHRRR